MNNPATADLGALLSSNAYPGRGIVIGTSADGKKAMFAYFIMGRSENSRNRVFVEKKDELVIYPFDESKVTDPSLIIYSPVRRVWNQWVVTNGDQTDTVVDGLLAGKSFAISLESRKFEPDAPNYTPRISGLLDLEGGYRYKLSILKCTDGKGGACGRYCFVYEPEAGIGHFIHTYAGDGQPLPSFAGEPERVSLPADIDALADMLWSSLDPDNKVSLYVCAIDLETLEAESRLFNKNKKA